MLAAVKRDEGTLCQSQGVKIERADGGGGVGGRGKDCVALVPVTQEQRRRTGQDESGRAPLAERRELLERAVCVPAHLIETLLAHRCADDQQRRFRRRALAPFGAHGGGPSRCRLGSAALRVAPAPLNADGGVEAQEPFVVEGLEPGFDERRPAGAEEAERIP